MTVVDFDWARLAADVRAAMRERRQGRTLAGRACGLPDATVSAASRGGRLSVESLARVLPWLGRKFEDYMIQSPAPAVRPGDKAVYDRCHQCCRVYQRGEPGSNHPLVLCPVCERLRVQRLDRRFDEVRRSFDG